MFVYLIFQRVCAQANNKPKRNQEEIIKKKNRRQARLSFKFMSVFFILKIGEREILVVFFVFANCIIYNMVYERYAKWSNQVAWSERSVLSYIPL